MKTVGQIIKTARQKRGFSVDQLSGLTKIDSKYISALEADKYSDLPSETFAKGFIRNLSIRLDLNPNELVAIFRRDFRLPDHRKISPRPRRQKIFLLAGVQLLPYIFGGIVFLIYLFFQFRAILTPPNLEIIKPASGAVLVSPVEVQGNTSVDSSISINEDTKVRPDSAGSFSSKISLPIGETILEIKSTNRFSRSTIKKIPVTVISR